MNTTEKMRVLFLYSHNQACSQMAEGLLKKLGGDAYEVYSAGSAPAEWGHPMAVIALAQIGIDIS